jgi:hypothetical protein
MVLQLLQGEVLFNSMWPNVTYRLQAAQKANITYFWWPIMAFHMQPLFRFQSATVDLILMQTG